MTLVDDVVAIAKASNSISEEDRKAVIEAAPKMNEEELMKVKRMIFEIGEYKKQAFQHENNLWDILIQDIQHKQREEQKAEEVKERTSEDADAEKLLSDI